MEEMSELFYKEPYRREFDAKVVACNACDRGYETELEDTLFYPEGGGQPADHGTLNGTAVGDVQRKNGTILHYTEKSFKTGDTVHGCIDWNRRFDHMQQHTGEHIVSGLVHKHYGYDNVSFHMGETVQIDFNGPISWEQLQHIEMEANELVMKNEKVQISYPSKEELSRLSYRSKKELNGKVRIVTIPEGDVCACCGTHVSHTGEIGLVKFLSLTARKKGCRIEMLSGRRAVAYMQKVYNCNHEVSVLLSAKPLETPQGTSAILKEFEDCRYKLKDIRNRELEKQADSYEDGLPLIIFFGENIERLEIVALADRLIKEKHTGIAAVLSREKGGYRYGILSQEYNLAEKAKEINKELNGKGGGKPDIIQGSFAAEESEIREVLERILK